MIPPTMMTSAPRKRRGWLRAMAWVFGILIVLLVAGYVVATSVAFFKGVILPRVGKAIQAQVTVSDASISPFSQVILQNLKVQTTGSEPLVTIAEVRLCYSLMDILRGNIHVDEVTLASPTVTLVANPDGSSNLDPLLKSQQAKPALQKPLPAAKATGARPLQFDLRRFALTDATLRQVKNNRNGTRDAVEFSRVNVTLDDLKNGQTGKLGLTAVIRVENTNGLLEAKLGGDYTVALAADLKPTLIKGGTRLDVTRATGALADMAAFGAELDVEVTPTDIKGVALHFKKGDARLGELRLSGPFDMAKSEGSLSIELADIDKQLLNLASARSGLDFGRTAISSTNHIVLTKAGSVITASGRLAVSKFQLTRASQTTPQLDLDADYSVTVDRGQNTAVLRGLTLTGTQNGATLLKAELASPMQIGWGGSNNAVGDSSLTWAVSSLNLADWKPFLGEAAPTGIVNAKARLLSQQGGKQLTFDVDSGIDHLNVNAGGHHITDATITLQASGRATDLKQFDLTSCKLEVTRQNQELVSVTGSGTYDKASETADMQVVAKVVLAPLFQALALPGMSEFQGQFPATPLEAKMHVVASLLKHMVDVRQLQVTLAPTARATNQVQLSGQVDLSQANAIQGNLKLAADSLDFTGYYDVFMGGRSTVTAGTAPTSSRTRATPVPASAPADAITEPAPVKLPLNNFTATATIRRLYLREVELADWQTTVTIDGGHVVLNPFKLALNGAPVNAMLDLDLGVQGWKYDWSLSAQAIPLAPLVNSFQPERKGILGGTLTAQAKLVGVGLTGASLQKNLAGQLDMSCTNLNLAVDNIQGDTVYTRLLKTLVSTIAVIPDLANDPSNTATALFSGLAGLGGASTSSGGSLTADLQKSPINVITLHGSAGSGRVNVLQATVQSPAFEAQAHDGTIMLAKVLNDSPLLLPISVSLERTVAQRIRMAGHTAPNATYAKLPDFLTMKGTLGNAKADIKYVALASAILQGTGGKGTQIGGALQNLSGLLNNSASATTNALATKNQAPVKNLLKGFLGR